MSLTRRTLVAIIYMVLAPTPLIYLALVIASTPGSLVSGIVIGSIIPLIALVSAILTGIGLILIFFEKRARRRIWPLVIATLVASIGLLLHLSN